MNYAVTNPDANGQRRKHHERQPPGGDDLGGPPVKPGEKTDPPQQLKNCRQQAELRHSIACKLRLHVLGNQALDRVEEKAEA